MGFDLLFSIPLQINSEGVFYKDVPIMILNVRQFSKCYVHMHS